MSLIRSYLHALQCCPSLFSLTWSLGVFFYRYSLDLAWRISLNLVLHELSSNQELNLSQMSCAMLKQAIGCLKILLCSERYKICITNNFSPVLVGQLLQRLSFFSPLVHIVIVLTGRAHCQRQVAFLITLHKFIINGQSKFLVLVSIPRALSFGNLGCFCRTWLITLPRCMY